MVLRGIMVDDKDRQSIPIITFVLNAALVFSLSMVVAQLTGTMEAIRFADLFQSIQSAIWMSVGILLGYAVQIFVHELGHLLAGLLSGYTFISFRAGRLMLSMQEGKLRRTWLTVPGTMGQCLMAPPPPRNGQFPFVLYNLGGGGANLLIGLMLLILMMVFPWPVFARPIGFGLVTVGIYLGITNLVPASMQGIRNDGANVRALRADEIVRQAFWAILQISADLVAGKRLRDTSPGLYVIPTAADRTDPIICNWGALQVSFYEDWHDFASAKRLAREWLESKGMPVILKLELLGMMVFYDLIGDYRPDDIRRLYVTELQRHSGGFRNSLSRLRLDYAYELLLNRDIEAARLHLQQFESVSAEYPYKGEVQSERELIAMVDELAYQRG